MGSPQHVRLEGCEAQVGEMQGAAEGGHPKQTTPQRGGVSGRRSRLPASASRLQHYMLRTTQRWSLTENTPKVPVLWASSLSIRSSSLRGRPRRAVRGR